MSYAMIGFLIGLFLGVAIGAIVIGLCKLSKSEESGAEERPAYRLPDGVKAAPSMSPPAGVSG